MKSIPVAMRERILKLYDQDKSTVEIAAFCGFCVAAVRRVRQHFKAWGTVEPQTHLCGRKTLLTAPRQARLQKLVALCHLMQALAGPNPFYLACRTVQRLFNLKTHEQPATWLRILRKRGVLTEVIKGGPTSMRASRFHYRNAAGVQQGGPGL